MRENIKQIELGSGTNDGRAISTSNLACYGIGEPNLSKTGTLNFRA